MCTLRGDSHGWDKCNERLKVLDLLDELKRDMARLDAKVRASEADMATMAI
jgi:hypothetical protein